jgi:parvulin-like peptidyl-prolyl isomerase
MATEHDEEVETTEHSEHHSRKSAKGKNSLLTVGVVVIIAIVIVGALAWLYTGNISSAKEKVFKAIPLPAALVDMKPVAASTVIERVALAKKLMESQGIAEGAKPSDTYDQIIDSKKLEAVASQKKVSVTKAGIDEEYKNIVTQYAAGDEEGFKSELQNTYQMTPEDFKDQVIRQELINSQLMLWYNQQEDLNKASYDKIRSYQERLDKGESFDDVARTYTEDEATKDFAGDSGMIPYDDLLPEFREALMDNKVGDVKLVPSRYGLHILKVLELNNDGENGVKQIHLQQIFLKQTGFTDWLTKETDNIRVIKLLKF